MKRQRVCSLRGKFHRWKWILTLKKTEQGSARGDFIPRPPLRRQPHANHVPLTVEGNMISMGSAKVYRQNEVHICGSANSNTAETIKSVTSLCR